MKEIDTKKIREAIHFLRSQGRYEGADCVWDLLDHFVAQETEPLMNMKTPWRRAEPVIVGGSPKCRVTAWDSNVMTCFQKVEGTLTNEDISVPVCKVHGERFHGKDGGEFIQTLFGDEDE